MGERSAWLGFGVHLFKACLMRGVDYGEKEVPKPVMYCTKPKKGRIRIQKRACVASRPLQSRDFHPQSHITAGSHNLLCSRSL